MATDQQAKRPRPWSDDEKTLVRGNLDLLVSRAATTIGRTRFAVQCRIMQELGVSQKEIDRIRNTRQRQGPLARLLNSVWTLTNHQVVGGILLAFLLGDVLYRLIGR